MDEPQTLLGQPSVSPPLPHSLPELRKKVSDLKQSLAALHQQKEHAFGKRKEVDNQISGFVRALQQAKDKRDSLTKEVQDKKQERRQASRTIQQRVGEIKKLSEERQKLILKHRIRGSPTALKSEIDALEFQIETQGIPFSKEQELMKIIKEKKKQLAQMKELKAVFDRVRQIDQELQELRSKSEGAHRAVQQKAEASQVEHQELVKDAKLLRDLRKQRKELNAECTRLKEEFAKGSAELKPLLDELHRLGAEAAQHQEQRRMSHREQQKMSLQERGKLIEEKLRKGGKLTTEDLLVLQGME